MIERIKTFIAQRLATPGAGPGGRWPVGHGIPGKRVQRRCSAKRLW